MFRCYYKCKDPVIRYESMTTAQKEIFEHTLRLSAIKAKCALFFTKNKQFEPYFTNILKEDIKGLELEKEFLKMAVEANAELLKLKNEEVLKYKTDCAELVAVIEKVSAM